MNFFRKYFYKNNSLRNDMLYLDSILLIILAYFIYIGYKRGFVLSFSAFLLITIGAIVSYFVAHHFAITFFQTGTLFFYLFFFIFFIGCLIGIKKLLKKLEIYLLDLLKKSDLIWVNALLGAVLGFFKMAIIVFIVISVIGAFEVRSLIQPLSKSFVASSLYSVVRNISQINLMKVIRNMENPKNSFHQNHYVLASTKQIQKDKQH